MPRPTHAQVDTLMDCLEQHMHLARGRLTFHQRHRADELWQRIARTLNKMDGCRKDAATWKKFWSDKKNYCKKAFSLRAKEIGKTTGGINNVLDLSPQDIRILAMMGEEFRPGIPDVPSPLFPMQNVESNAVLPSTSEAEDESDAEQNMFADTLELSNTVKTQVMKEELRRPETPLSDHSAIQTQEAPSARKVPGRLRTQSALGSAQDRLFTMEQQRVDAKTRAAEALGSMAARLGTVGEAVQVAASAQAKVAEAQAETARMQTKTAEAQMRTSEVQSRTAEAQIQVALAQAELVRTLIESVKNIHR